MAGGRACWFGLAAVPATLAALAALSAAPARAEISPVPSEALRCMTPPEAERGAPEYDPVALEREEGGLIRAGRAARVSRQRATRRPVYFDLKTMDCPFDVRITYFQPFKPNRVAELERSRPERRPFLDWLSTIKIHAPEPTQLAILGEEFTVRVPCGTVDL